MNPNFSVRHQPYKLCQRRDERFYTHYKVSVLHEKFKYCYEGRDFLNSGFSFFVPKDEDKNFVSLGNLIWVRVYFKQFEISYSINKCLIRRIAEPDDERLELGVEILSMDISDLTQHVQVIQRLKACPVVTMKDRAVHILLFESAPQVSTLLQSLLSFDKYNVCLHQVDTLCELDDFVMTQLFCNVRIFE